jgi:hypothetical protein
MAEMGTALEQLTHGKIRQSHVQSPLPVGQMRGLTPEEPPDGDDGTPTETHPRMRDGGAYRSGKPHTQPGKWPLPGHGQTS